MYKRFLFFMTIALFLSSCSTTKYSSLNYANFYKQDYPENIFKTALFNANDSITELFVRVDLNVLALVTGHYQSDVEKYFVFDYSLVDGDKEKDILQTGRIPLANRQDSSQRYLSFKLKLQTPSAGNFVLFPSIESLESKNVFTMRIPFSKGVPYAEQNYLVLNSDGSIHWNDFISGDEKVRIKVNNPAIKTLYVNWFPPKFSPAIVPFAPVKTQEVKKLEATEPFKVAVENGETAPLSFKDLGVYQFKVNPGDPYGFSLLKFYKEYPYVTTDAQRLFTLRYLNPSYEFADLMAKDPAEAVHDFWYAKSRKESRTQDMMGTYYGRAQRANELFTSYKEGWKTDRGMIFMVYGPPDEVHKYKDSEVWEYGNDAYYSGLRFRFNKVDNPFTQNDYRLLRETFYEPGWQGIVNNWRTDI